MHSFRARLLASAVLASAALAAAPAFADEPAAPVTDVGELEVTGTRLILPDYTLSNPVSSVSGQTLEYSGVTNLTEFLADMPALVNSFDLEEGSDQGIGGSAGLNLLNLRNLGTDRTLVLVNGRRHVAADPGSAAVDVNTIPIALIERVDVLTGGASAVYGADGVTGVVNFILKEDFQGLDIRAQTGVTEAGGAAQNFISVAWGRNFNDDRGNFTLAFEGSKDDPLRRDDRAYTRTGQRVIFVDNPAELAVPGNDPNIFDKTVSNDVRYFDTSPGGSIYTNVFTAPTNSGVSFQANGQPFDPGLPAGDFLQIGGSGSLTDLYNDDLLAELDRQTFNSTFRYDLTDKIRLFGEVKYNHIRTFFTAQPTYDYGLFIPQDNPFIPAAAYADALTPGGNFTAAGINALGLPGPGVLVARDNFDLGEGTHDIKRDTWRLVFGAKGDLTDYLRYEVSYVYGQTQTEDNYETRINERFFAATDVVMGPNGPVCRSNLDPSALPAGDLFAQAAYLAPGDTTFRTFTPGPNSGCVPVNIFGEGAFNQQALDWILTDDQTVSKITQNVATAFISGTSTPWFELPAGPISYVLGAEYRRETSLSTPGPYEQEGAIDQINIVYAGQGVISGGSFNVKEVFGELSLPIFKDQPFAKDLTFDAAVRYSDYSTSGGSTSWKAGLRWSINDMITLRGTYARAVRAPNITELFQAPTQTFATISDPCDDNNINAGDPGTSRVANCTAAFGALGVALPFNDTSSEATQGVFSGNVNLNPEAADTYTVGIVLQPSFIPGFTFAVDYYNIELANAIQAFSAQTIVNKCYDLPQPNDFCALVTRTATGVNPGRIVSFTQTTLNVAKYTTAGWDISLRWNIDPADYGVDKDIGRFGLSIVANKLDDLTFTELAGATPDSDLGEPNAPEWQVNLDLTWIYGDFTVNYGFNYFSKTERFSAVRRADPDYVDPQYWYYSARATHDIQARWKVNDVAVIYGGINNFTNQEPDIQDYNYPVSPRGREYYVGVTARF